MGAQSDRLIRAIALGLGEGLKGKLEELVRKFPEIRDQAATVRIEMDTGKMTYKYVEVASRARGGVIELHRLSGC